MVVWFLGLLAALHIGASIAFAISGKWSWSVMYAAYAAATIAQIAASI